MGRIKLRRALTVGLILILFLSLCLSAVGVAGLVRNYLWNRGVREANSVGKNVARFLEVRAKRTRAPLATGPQSRGVRRGLQRFNKGPNQLLLVKDGQIVLGGDDPDRRWDGLIPKVGDGVQRLTYDDQVWQVVSRSVESDLADRFIIVRPWSPSQKLIRALVLYQIIASVVVLGLALVVASYFSARLARPLEELRRKTKEVGEDQVETLSSSRVAEIAELQSSFLEMSGRVQEAMLSQRRFVADASHELKTPLTAISGMLELLHGRPDMEPEDRVQALGVAKKEAARMESLIADLLLLSRAQAKRSGEKEDVVLSELVEEQLETLKVLFPEQEFRLSGDTDARHFINPPAFSRIMRNLLENAARYAEGGPITVRLKSLKEGVAVMVKDTGPGISAEKLPQLFERFYRTDSGRARSEGGHGLGLAIVKALVEEAGGRITCKSKPGEGAEFRILFLSPPDIGK